MVTRLYTLVLKSGALSYNRCACAIVPKLLCLKTECPNLLNTRNSLIKTLRNTPGRDNPVNLTISKVKK